MQLLITKTITKINLNTSILGGIFLKKLCYNRRYYNKIIKLMHITGNTKIAKTISLGESARFGIRADTIDRFNITLKATPSKIKDEIPTLNQFGYMKMELDEYSREFLETASDSNEPVLEIGTAYGWLVLQALGKGATVIANDISEDHLSILLSKVPEEYLSRLFLIPTSFPYDLELPVNSISAVIASRIFHFLDGICIEDGLRKVYNFLKPGGKFYFTACSLYHYSVGPTMADKFNYRVAEGIKWPGLILDQRTNAPDHAPYVQDLLNVFDIPQLERLLPEHGFRIDRISLFDYPNDTDSGGKGHVGFVATKI